MRQPRFPSSSCLTVNSTRTSADTASYANDVEAADGVRSGSLRGRRGPSRHRLAPRRQARVHARERRPLLGRRLRRHPRDGRRARAHDRGLAAQRRAHGPRRHGLLGHGRAARAPRARDTRDDHGLRGRPRRVHRRRDAAPRRCGPRARRAADRDRASEREPARRAPGHPDRRNRESWAPSGCSSRASSRTSPRPAARSPSAPRGRPAPLRLPRRAGDQYLSSPAASPTSWSCSVSRSSPPRSSRRSSSTTCSSAGGSATASSFWASPSSGSRSQST